MSRKRKDKIPLIIYILLVNTIINDIILIFWFRYSHVLQWFAMEFKSDLIGILKLFSNAH